MLANVEARSAQLMRGLVLLAKKYPIIIDVRGRGLMVGVEFGGRDGSRKAEKGVAVVSGRGAGGGRLWTKWGWWECRAVFGELNLAAVPSAPRQVVRPRTACRQPHNPTPTRAGRAARGAETQRHADARWCARGDALPAGAEHY
jgi:hypothetical protein